MDKEKNWRPHITIDLYNCSNRDQFIEMIDEIIEKIKSFEIEFNNLKWKSDYEKNTIINFNMWGYGFGSCRLW